MSRGSHARSHARPPWVGAALAALALVAAITLGWGLPVVGVEAASSSLAPHALRTADAAADVTLAVVAPVVEAVTPRVERHASNDRVRDVLGATTVAVAVLLLVAQRRRRAFHCSHAAHAAVVANGGRAPPA